MWGWAACFLSSPRGQALLTQSYMGTHTNYGTNHSCSRSALRGGWAAVPRIEPRRPAARLLQPGSQKRNPTSISATARTALPPTQESRPPDA